MSAVRDRLARLVSSAGGRSTRLVASVEAQVAVAIDATGLCRSLVIGTLGSATARARMTDLEHAGDNSRAELVRMMGRMLVTPIDREDLFRLSRAIDDVVDDLRDFVREYDLFDAAPTCDMEPLLQPLLEGLRELDYAIIALRERPEEAFEASLRTKKRAGGVRQAYQMMVAGLFRNGASHVSTFKDLELLRRLDGAGLRLHDAADALADGALKRVT